MGDDRGDDQDGSPVVEPRRPDEEPCASDAVDAEQGGWVDSVRRDRPVLYATRHLIKPMVQLVVVILGIGALLQALLPRVIDVEWLASWGREHLSWVPDPLGWAAGWVGDHLGDVQVADWIGTVFRNAKWWMPILVAIGVGVIEVLRRWEAAIADDSAPVDGDAPAEGDDGVGDADGHADAARRDDDRRDQGDVREELS